MLPSLSRVIVALGLSLTSALAISVVSPGAQASEPVDSPTRVEVERSGKLTTTCEWFTKKKPYAICITTTEGSRNPDILYYMHGAGKNERHWVKRWGGIRKAWEQIGYDAPTVVNFSFGPIWLMAEKNRRGTSGVFNFIADALIPRVEESLGGLRGRRIVMGESMGGFNTSQLVMKRPEMFARAAILCPAILPFGPYSTLKEVHEFVKRTPSSWGRALWNQIMMRIFFPDQKTWDETANPLKIGRTRLNRLTPPLYVSCGRKDRFGFFEGAERFARIAQEQGTQVIWNERPGDHCDMDEAEVARFLAD